MKDRKDDVNVLFKIVVDFCGARILNGSDNLAFATYSLICNL